MKIAVIGTGNLGQAIITGLIKKDFLQQNMLWATRRNVASIQFLAEKGVNVTQNNAEAVQNSDIIILGVKPFMIEEVLQDLKPYLKPNHQLVSLAAGFSLDQLKQLVHQDIAIHRVMPNTAAAVNESITMLTSHAENKMDNKQIQELFNQVGLCVEIQENQMDAATILGASGIAYAMRFVRAMAQGGVEIGFTAQTATTIVNQMMKGAATLLLQSENHVETEIDKVTTPKGCTIVGLNAMEENGFSSSVVQGVTKSYQKLQK